MVYTPLMEINTLTDVTFINFSSNKIIEIDTGDLSTSQRINTLNSLF